MTYYAYYNKCRHNKSRVICHNKTYDNRIGYRPANLCRLLIAAPNKTADIRFRKAGASARQATGQAPPETHPEP